MHMKHGVSNRPGDIARSIQKRLRIHRADVDDDLRGSRLSLYGPNLFVLSTNNPRKFRENIPWISNLKIDAGWKIEGCKPNWVFLVPPKKSRNLEPYRCQPQPTTEDAQSAASLRPEPNETAENATNSIDDRFGGLT